MSGFKARGGGEGVGVIAIEGELTAASEDALTAAFTEATSGANGSCSWISRGSTT